MPAQSGSARASDVAPGGEADERAMAQALAAFLEAAGLPAAARGEAPARTAAAWREHLLNGYDCDPLEVLRPTWPESAGEIVTLTGIPFVSVCEHHLLPFFGRAHIAYLPAGELTGLSRIEDLVRCLSRRLQVQERLGQEIAETLMQAVSARGAGCVLEAEHLCVFARGRQRGSCTRTAAFVGEFEGDRALQEHCLGWLRPDTETTTNQEETA